jgi:hypothetical protein
MIEGGTWAWEMGQKHGDGIEAYYPTYFVELLPRSLGVIQELCILLPHLGWARAQCFSNGNYGRLMGNNFCAKRAARINPAFTHVLNYGKNELLWCSKWMYFDGAITAMPESS